MPCSGLPTIFSRLKPPPRLHQTGMMAAMRRYSAASVLAALILTMQVGPMLHLVTHRNDHTHGPRPASSHLPRQRASLGTSEGQRTVGQRAAGVPSATAHEAAHAEGRAHTHGPRDTRQPRPDAWGAHAPYGYSTPGLVRRLLSALAEVVADAGRFSGTVHDHTSGPAHSHEESPSPDHGEGSAAHFGLALIETPPATPLLPSVHVLADADVAYASTLRSRPGLRRAPRGPPRPRPAIRAC